MHSWLIYDYINSCLYWTFKMYGKGFESLKIKKINRNSYENVCAPMQSGHFFVCFLACQFVCKVICYLPTWAFKNKRLALFEDSKLKHTFYNNIMRKVSQTTIYYWQWWHQHQTFREQRGARQLFRGGKWKKYGQSAQKFDIFMLKLSNLGVRKYLRENALITPAPGAATDY